MVAISAPDRRPVRSDDARVHVTRHLCWGALLVSAAWVAVIALWRDAPFALTFDDAYYYFGISENLAGGAGSTFDGINPTNGYHPLWMLVSAPVFALGFEGATAVRVLLMGQFMAWGVSLVILAGMVSDFVNGWPRLADQTYRTARSRATATLAVVFVLVTGNPFVVKTFVNGLESGITVVLYMLLLMAVVRADGDVISEDTTRASRWGIAVLLALLFLGRTDAALVIACLGIWSLPHAIRGGRPALGRLLDVFALPVAVIVGYLVTNAVVFGHPLQVSGLVKQANPTPLRCLLAIGVVAAAVATGAFTRRLHQHDGSRLPRTVAMLRTSGWFASFTILAVGYYTVLTVQQWLWYFAPIVLMLIVLLLTCTADLLEGAAVEGAADSWKRSVAPIQLLIVAPLLMLLALQVRSFTDDDTRSIQLANQQAAKWIDAHLPEGAVLASWDAGVVGYYSDRPVVNLDGVVNSHEYAEAIAADTRDELLRDEGVGFVVNHGRTVDGEDPDIEELVRTVFGDAAADGLEVVESFGFTYSGTTTRDPRAGPQAMAVFVYRLPDHW